MKIFLANRDSTIFLQDKHEIVDLIITDPPYKMNYTSGSKTSAGLSEKWQGNLIAGDKNAGIENDTDFSDWLKIAYQVLKPKSHLYIFVNDKNIQKCLNEAEKVGFKLHNILVWKKNNKTPNRWYMKNAEFIIFLRKGKSFPINNLSSSQILEYKNISGKNKTNPTQKPVDLLSVLVENSSQKGDLILDLFSGSGSTAIASLLLGRRFIGLDIDRTQYLMSKNRIRKEVPLCKFVDFNTILEKDN